jgi:hypothetical protein
MSERGIYGAARVGADGSGSRGSSLGTWIVGGLLVGGAVLWAKHQSDQIGKLYSVAGLPQQSFVADLRARTKALSGAAREKIHALTESRGGAKKDEA